MIEEMKKVRHYVDLIRTIGFSIAPDNFEEGNKKLDYNELPEFPSLINDLEIIFYNFLRKEDREIFFKQLKSSLTRLLENYERHGYYSSFIYDDNPFYRLGDIISYRLENPYEDSDSKDFLVWKNNHQLRTKLIEKVLSYTLEIDDWVLQIEELKQDENTGENQNTSSVNKNINKPQEHSQKKRKDLPIKYRFLILKNMGFIDTQPFIGLKPNQQVFLLHRILGYSTRECIKLLNNEMIYDDEGLQLSIKDHIDGLLNKKEKK